MFATVNHTLHGCQGTARWALERLGNRPGSLGVLKHGQPLTPLPIQPYVPESSSSAFRAPRRGTWGQGGHPLVGLGEAQGL